MSSTGPTLPSQADDGPHPLHAEIRHFMEEMYRPFCLEKINKWISVGIAKPFRVTDYFGREIVIQGVGFEGSPRRLFWGGFAEPFLKDFIRKTIEHAVRLADDRGIERAGALLEARRLLRSMVTWAFHSMRKVEINHLNRPRQTNASRNPPPIRWTDTAPLVARMNAFVDEIVNGWPPGPTRTSSSAGAQSSRHQALENIAGSSRPWTAKRRGGPPLRSWHAICRALGCPNNPARRGRLKRLNERTAGPIKWDGRVPEVDAGELAAWIEDTEARAASAEAERAKLRETTRDLEVGHPEHLRDQALHQKRRRSNPRRPTS